MTFHLVLKFKRKLFIFWIFHLKAFLSIFLSWSLRSSSSSQASEESFHISEASFEWLRFIHSIGLILSGTFPFFLLVNFIHQAFLSIIRNFFDFPNLSSGLSQLWSCSTFQQDTSQDFSDNFTIILKSETCQTFWRQIHSNRIEKLVHYCCDMALMNCY